jgi:hypothetical protein
MTWYFYLPIGYMHFKHTAEAAVSQVQRDAAAPTQNIDFRCTAVKKHIVNLKEESAPD